MWGPFDADMSKLDVEKTDSFNGELTDDAELALRKSQILRLRLPWIGIIRKFFRKAVNSLLHTLIYVRKLIN